MTRHRRAGSRWRVKLVRMRKGPMDGASINIESQPHRPPPGFTRSMRESAQEIGARYSADMVLPGTEFDELVVGQGIHIEQMGGGQYWMSIAGIVINLSMDRDGRPLSAMLYPAGSYGTRVPGCRYFVDDIEDTEETS